MKQYLLFAGNDYYPQGGADDLIGFYEILDDALQSHNPAIYEYSGGWAHIYSLTELKIVAEFKKRKMGIDMKKHKVQKVITLTETPQNDVKLFVGGKEVKVKPVVYIEHELSLN